MTIVIITVTIMTVIVKNYSGHMVLGMSLSCLHIPTTTGKKHTKMVMNISDEIDLDKELRVFSVGGL